MTGAARHRHARSRLRRPLHVAAVTVGAAAVASWSLGPTFAAADSGDVEVVNTETVQVYTDAEGAVDTKRVYEQVELSGQGTVTLDNPIALEGLRNLDGFGGVETEDGSQVTTTTVDGVEQLRSVSEFDGELPLAVSATYELDGEPVEPGDVVGESGHLVVEYTIKNVSGVATEISYPDGRGGEVTDTVEVPIPMVGSLTTVAPPTFDEVTSSQANMAGDGKGGTRLSFTATLIPPIGDDTAVFGYEADITDGVVPRADFTGLPVNPLKSPSFAKAAESYQGGAQTGVALTEGAVEIDDNLLKLRDGAGDLLAGLIKLQAGSEELSQGLVGQAAPGAAELAAGAGELSDGLGQLDTGAGQLAEGTGKLSVGVGVLMTGTSKLRDGSGALSLGAIKLRDGASDAAAGGAELADGAQRLGEGIDTLDGKLPELSSGVGQLAAGQKGLVDGLAKLRAGVSALPAGVRAQLAQNPDYQQLLGALQGVVAGIGTLSDTTQPTLLGGLNRIKGGLNGLTGNVDTTVQALDQALQGPVTADGTVARLRASIANIASAPDCGPVCRATASGTADAVAEAQTARLTELRNGLELLSNSVKAQITGPGAGIDQLRAGLSNGLPTTCDRIKADDSNPADDCGVAQAVQLVQGGIPQLIDGLTANISTSLLDSIGNGAPGCDPTQTLACAADALSVGGDDLVTGVADLVSGVEELNAGGQKVSAGAGKLAVGLGDLGEGTQQLADGSKALADGSVQLDDGVGELAAGAGELDTGAGKLAAGASAAAGGAFLLSAGSQELSDGIGDAADGSVQLADGLGTAADGAPKLVDGAQRLSDEGTKVLIGKGEDTAKSYGEMYASLVAGAERADTEDMAYGAPAGAEGLTAYSFVLQGEDGAGGRNLGRGLLAGGVAALAGGGLLIRRRFLV
ncbi:hypothetical protein [Nocardioides sp. AX2bis]|uniref:hypothetical protein n=1 Tax=Nocardioides sp. AX2bis TaxID=2653157 RepID=UPI0012F09E56|nr:hypothetical protein [Nocardioides sp. AX2bis]VXB69787.1 conserved exported hypothetical protein [Nocardioides sp. AX2bis]